MFQFLLTQIAKLKASVASANESVSLVKDANSEGSFGTVAALNTALTNIVKSMGNYTCYYFRISATANADIFVNTFIYYCTLIKGPNTNYCRVVMYPNASNDVIVGYKSTSDDWTFAKL